MCKCEDRPACGHLAEERADDAYWAERAYYGEEDEDRAYYEMLNAPDEDENETEEMGNEDAGLEESLFGDC